jgi:hypothetical protein
MKSVSQSGMSWFLRWGPALLMVVLIFAASSIPAGSLPSWEGPVDLAIKKGGHMIGYGLLALAMLRGVGRQKRAAYRIAWVLAVLYAMSDEFHQRFVPGRGASTLDVLIDGLGAAGTLLVHKAWVIRRTAQSSNSSSKSSSSSHPSAGAR